MDRGVPSEVPLSISTHIGATHKEASGGARLRIQSPPAPSPSETRSSRHTAAWSVLQPRVPVAPVRTLVGGCHATDVARRISIAGARPRGSRAHEENGGDSSRVRWVRQSARDIAAPTPDPQDFRHGSWRWVTFGYARWGQRPAGSLRPGGRRARPVQAGRSALSRDRGMLPGRGLRPRYRDLRLWPQRRGLSSDETLCRLSPPEGLQSPELPLRVSTGHV